jgi:hypothetical protein
MFDGIGILAPAAEDYVKSKQEIRNANKDKIGATPAKEKFYKNFSFFSIKNLFEKQPAQPCEEFLDMVKNHPIEGAKALKNNFDNLKCFNKKEPYSEAFKDAIKQKVHDGAYSMEEYNELHSIFDKALDHGGIKNYLEMESILGRPCCYKVAGDSHHNDSTDH